MTKIILLVCTLLCAFQSFAQDDMEEEMREGLKLPPPSLNLVELKKHECAKVRHLPANIRAKNYPFNKASKIQVISYKESNMLGEEILASVDTVASKPLAINKDSLFQTRIIEAKYLDKQQIQQLTDILFNYGYKGKVTYYTLRGFLCYNPRNAIYFFDEQGKEFESIYFCFECEKYSKSSKKVKIGEFCTQKFDMLRWFFSKCGIVYGIKEG